MFTMKEIEIVLIGDPLNMVQNQIKVSQEILRNLYKKKAL